ncbi:ABC transporter ATP-binding protein [Thermosulfurimonas dismutans]|uniref:Lipoprotein releasing system ATP-binding protein LolD n=1 Tax=Thermosulfurimonas dismutans TaxID=999894 RepID=A0A179D363_9BACT|nr:ABC transporter ATP-binding protein [Thermosulfurimonas dismutans]OAQ20520.1 Lipoprotein releasing system ATP-binding protein LolD [Thermosulfurimonas dismutans]
MVNPPAIEVRGLRKVFPHPEGDLEILKGLDLTVAPGEKVAIIGPSGVGKTTLLHILGGLEVPTEGRIYHFGEDIFSLSDEALSRFRNQHMGFVFQLHYLLPEFNTLENVMLPGLLAGLPREEARQRAENLLSQFGLSKRLFHRVTELSGGEKQRAAIARALLLNPRIVFADEPTGNLDDQNAEEMTEIFLHLNQKYATTLVVVTHNLRLAAKMDRILKLEGGKLREVSREKLLTLES